MDEVIPKWLEVGTSINVYYSPRNFNNRTLHIRAIVDGNHVAFRSWLNTQRSWKYEIREIEFFKMMSEMGYLKKTTGGGKLKWL
jgi:hypothetical protein